MILNGERSLTVGFHNVNTLNDDKLRHIAWSIMHHKIDLFHATDCRLTERSMTLAVTMIKSLLGIEVLVSYGAVSRPGEVGGYLSIIRGSLRSALCNKHVDATGLGISVEYTFQMSEGRLTVMGCYWPARSPHLGGSLWSQVKRGLQTKGIRLNPMSYIKQMISDRIIKLTSKGHRVILGGDLNHEPRGRG